MLSITMMYVLTFLRQPEITHKLVIKMTGNKAMFSSQGENVHRLIAIDNGKQRCHHIGIEDTVEHRSIGYN